VTIFYPGFMSPDSIVQLGEARKMSFDGIHPPIMGLLWALTDRVVPGPGGLFVLHSVVFWASLWLLATALASRRSWLGWLVLGVGLTPPALALTNTVWKDIGMAASLLLGVALIVTARQRARPSLAYAALPLLFYAAAVRHNAMPALVPLAFLWGEAIRPASAPRARWLAAAVLVVGLTVGVQVFNRSVIAEDSPPPAQAIFIYDLVGMSLRTQEVLLPQYLQPGMTLEKLRASYVTFAAYLLFLPPLQLPVTNDPGEFQALRQTWWQNVRRHWWPYLRHRWRVFEISIGIGPLLSPFHPSPHAGIGDELMAEFGVSYAPSRVRDLMMRVFETATVVPVFRAWTWLALAALIAGLGVVTRVASAPVLALSLSALFYGLTYFFVGIGCEFRFQFWTFLSTSIAAIWLAADLVSARTARRAPGAFTA
jgi:hypothetical protein